jgi:hypothetical protein
VTIHGYERGEEKHDVSYLTRNTLFHGDDVEQRMPDDQAVWKDTNLGQPRRLYFEWQGARGNVDTPASSIVTSIRSFPLDLLPSLPLLHYPDPILITMDAPTVGPIKKKRDRAKERQKRREKQEKLCTLMRKCPITRPTDLMARRNDDGIHVWDSNQYMIGMPSNAVRTHEERRLSSISPPPSRMIGRCTLMRPLASIV